MMDFQQCFCPWLKISEREPMDLLDTLKTLGGYWHYDGGKYLAELTSRKVSDTYANLSVLTCRPAQLEDVVEGVVAKFYRQLEADKAWDAWNAKFDTTRNGLYVCGPAMGGVTLAYEVARQLGGTAIFTEPVYGVREEDMHDPMNPSEPPHRDVSVYKTGQQLKRFTIPDGATVLFVEDVVTTGKSTREMISAVWQSFGPVALDHADVNILPYVLSLVNRSGADAVWTLLQNDGTPTPDEWVGTCWNREHKIISLAEINARTWDTIEEAREELAKWDCERMGGPPDPTSPDSADMLREHQEKAQQLEALRPKENWDLLTKSV